MSKLILGKKALSGAMEVVLRILFVLGIGITLSIPFTLKPLNDALYGTPMSTQSFWCRLVFLMVFGVLMVLFVYHAARVFRTINEEDPFVERNVKTLSQMALLCLLAAVDCTIYTILEPSFFTLLLLLVFFFFAGFLLVLREVFHRAVMYKQENDFTI